MHFKLDLGYAVITDFEHERVFAKQISEYAVNCYLKVIYFTEWICRYTHSLIFRGCFKVAVFSAVKYPGKAECILSFRYDVFEVKHMSSQNPLFKPL